MKLSKTLLAGAMLFSAASVMAQETVTEYTYTPNWYIQGQFGGQETLGESSFGHLFNPNAQLTVGYNFNPYIGARLAFNAWQSKGALNFQPENGPEYRGRWKWNYVAPTVDAVINLTNLVGGYNPNRHIDLNLIAGIGANIAFSNEEANNVNAQLNNYMKAVDPNYSGNMLENIWDGTKARFVGQFGLGCDYNINEKVAVGIELMANLLSDKYNSKKANNADWYFNGLVGVKYTFGPKYSKSTRVIEPVVAQPQVIERIIERVVEAAPAPAVQESNTNAVAKAEMLRRDVFFKINNFNIAKDEQYKVSEVAQFLKDHPNATVVITGYADKGTGTLAINLRLSKQRANTVANALKKQYGIAASRITVKSMGEEEDQPYSDPVDNRVAICVCE